MFPSRLTAVLVSFVAVGCAAPPPTSGSLNGSAAAAPTPIYSRDTGQLEQLVTDTNGDGVVDTRAYMRGRQLERIEVDRNRDGAFDRFEHYVDRPPERVDPTSPAGRVEIERVDEANGLDQRITRREFYEKGELARVEDDSNNDGRPDRWELYDQGVLARIDMDLKGSGFPTRRLVYRRDGSIERVEVDPEGTGAWREPPPDSKGPARKD